jgi:hypothetical protein
MSKLPSSRPNRPIRRPYTRLFSDRGERSGGRTPVVGSFLILLILGLLLASGACQKLSPEEKVEKTRSQFSVQASPFSIRETPLSPPEDQEDLDEAIDERAGGVADETEETDDGYSDDQPLVRKDVLIDVLVGTESSEPLPGLTLDVDHVDADRQLKRRYLYWIDTSSVIKGSNIQVTVVIEDVDYQEGDAFSVSIRSPVPADERSGYREF